MTTPDLPPPDLEDADYELWGQNVKADCWFAAKMRAYGDARAAAAVLAEREKSEAITARDVARKTFAECESVEDTDTLPKDSQEVERFKAGARYAAKKIRNEVGNWLTSKERAAIRAEPKKEQQP
jgi:hypothetical protein